MKKQLLISTFVLISFYSQNSTANFDLANIKQLFKEPNAQMTPFTTPDNTGKVEQERLGDGWRYITHGDKKFKNVILYNHGHKGRKKHYAIFASDRDLYKKANWYYENGVNFYATLRKQTTDLYGEYGRAVEGIEVFHHLTKEVKKLHGNNVNICYAGHSEGGGPVVYASMFLNGKGNVAISPSSSEYSLFQLTDKEFYESPEYYNKSKNLTILMGERELEWDKFNKLIEKAQTLKHIKTKLFKNFHHQDMARSANLDEIGPAVLEGCGFN